ncbi:hypothetical protein CPB86DRAFT_788481 [Serendipita vermifera]|nr:hypothetical protein CPB86DRAFT_788481 [Serendipita vermifera]
MDRILRLFRKRRAKPLLTQIGEVLKPLPSLPVEIWLIIFRMALRPSFVIDAEFETFEIDQAHLYLNSTSQRSERAARRIMSKTKHSLRGVCHSWKEAIDNIDTSERWTWDVTCFRDAPPTDTHQCKRLNLRHSLSVGSPIHCQYTHPVSALMIDVSPCDFMYRGPTYMTTLAETISFSEHLRVLNLNLHGCKASKNVLKEIESIHIPLTTLGLYTQSVNILQTSLEIPTLISLFITVPTYVDTDWDEHPSRLQWKFPSLRNFWWADSHLSRHIYLQDGHPLFLGILRDHFESIRALRMHTIAREVADEDSSLCWTRMPMLQALATNFSRQGETHAQYEARHRPKAIKSDSLQYLVALDQWVPNPQDVVDGLQGYIQGCKKLQGVHLVGYPSYKFERTDEDWSQSRSDNWWDSGAMHRLELLCRKDSVLIKYGKDAKPMDI